MTKEVKEKIELNHEQKRVVERLEKLLARVLAIGAYAEAAKFKTRLAAYGVEAKI